MGSEASVRFVYLHAAEQLWKEQQTKQKQTTKTNNKNFLKQATEQNN